MAYALRTPSAVVFRPEDVRTFEGSDFTSGLID